MQELLTATPDSLTAYRAWLTSAAAEIEPQIDRDTLSEFDKDLHAFVAKVVRRAKAHAYRLGFDELANILPERRFKTPLDGCLRLRECARFKTAAKSKGNSRLTPPQVAERYGVSPDTVRKWIEQGDLRAIDVAAVGSKRARYRIEAEALADFDKRKIPDVAPPTPRRRRSKTPKLLVTKFSAR